MPKGIPSAKPPVVVNSGTQTRLEARLAKAEEAIKTLSTKHEALLRSIAEGHEASRKALPSQKPGRLATATKQN